MVRPINGDQEREKEKENKRERRRKTDQEGRCRKGENGKKIPTYLVGNENLEGNGNRTGVTPVTTQPSNTD